MASSGSSPTPQTSAAHLVIDDAPATIPALVERLAVAGGRLRTLSTVRRLPNGTAGAGEAGTATGDATGETGETGETASEGTGPGVEIDLEVEGLTEADLLALVEASPGVRTVHPTRTLDRVFGKRIIVIGGGAQVAQVALGAVSEADRHNLRGERISVDTIPLVGEAEIAAAVRAVADLPRARLLVLAGSIMGGDITKAADELRAQGIPIIALNMVGSIGEAVDLVVSDPVQAGTMAVMAIADTAAFDLGRQRGRRY